MEELRLLKEARELEEAKLNMVQQMSDERRSELEDSYRSEVENMLAQVEAEQEEARLLARKAGADPVTWLDEDDLRQANARAGFVREELEELSEEAVLTRMELAIENGDKAGAWLLLRYGPKESQSPSFVAQKKFIQTRAALSEFVIPEEVRHAQSESHRRMLEAEKKRVELRQELWKLNGGKGTFNPWP